MARSFVDCGSTYCLGAPSSGPGPYIQPVETRTIPADIPRPSGADITAELEG